MREITDSRNRKTERMNNEMETQVTKLNPTDIVAETRKTTIIRRRIAPVVLTAMIFALLAIAGTGSSIGAAGPTSPHFEGSAVADDSSSVCQGRTTLTYYDSARG